VAADEEFAERPWGRWYVLDTGRGYKVKRIEVEPGHRLSYQRHTHRSEHWLVLTGAATFVIDGDVTTAGPGEHVDVAMGSAHRICNDGDELVVIIEIQRGSYTGEDDIERLEDDYRRCETP
jgi:mannose-6-phosphate isomerase-like protein (cupin superfamily)